jgi:hypothetical protein
MRINFSIEIERTPKMSPVVVGLLPVIGAWLANLMAPKQPLPPRTPDWSRLWDEYAAEHKAPDANGNAAL